MKERFPMVFIVDDDGLSPLAVELQSELNQRGAITPVIFITGHGDVPMAVEAMQHGTLELRSLS